MVYENIEIKNDSTNNHLSIINYSQKGKEYLYYTAIEYFSNFIKNFHEINELTIDGFNIELTAIQNNIIGSLNINILNNFSLNKRNIIEIYDDTYYLKI